MHNYGIDLAGVAAINAKSLKAYSSGTARLQKDNDGRRRFMIEDKAFVLVDEFDGGNPFCGIVRVVRKSDNAAVWSNYYHGWLTDEAFARNLSPEIVFNFMREALQHADPGTISRGPAEYEDKSRHLRYANTLDSGDIARFYGQEAVYYGGSDKPVYVCRYGGGVVNVQEDAGEQM